MSMPKAVRHINQARLMDRLLRTGPLSRADMARDLDMMRSTAGNLVTALQADGFIQAAADSPRNGDVGRPGRLFDVNAHHSYFIGADIGIGYLRAVLMDLKAQIVATRQIETQSDATPEQIAAFLAGLLPDLLGDISGASDRLRGLCVSIPGLIGFDGTIMRAPILGWQDVPFLDMVRTKLPELDIVLAENDANAFALSQMHRLRDTDVADALFLWIDAGVGGGIMHNRELVRGHNGYAGEFGHIFVGPNDQATDSPLPGSLESFIGRPALLARNTALGGSATSLDGFVTEIQAGSPAALQTLTIWAQALARGIADLTSIFNPAQIVLGGPVAVLIDHAGDQVSQTVKSHLIANHPVPLLHLSPTGANAAAIGCALLLHRSFLEIDKTLVFGGTHKPNAKYIA